MKTYSLILLLFLTIFSLNQNLFGQNSLDSSMVDQSPSYPGGENARAKFIEKNLNYPQDAILKQVEGTVYVKFIVEKDGSISNISILKGIGSGCDEETIRVLKLMPKWKAGTNKGEKVRVFLTMPVKFKLEKEDKNPEDLQKPVLF
ncbi:MAG: energy transducer TonB [Saprospiraceae bacterium]|nr:energy transducer TonB [Saprospiraceae bacterium]